MPSMVRIHHSPHKNAVHGVERRNKAVAGVAQLAERVLGKDEVTSSILVIGSRLIGGTNVGRTFRSAATGGAGAPPYNAGEDR